MKKIRSEIEWAIFRFRLGWEMCEDSFYWWRKLLACDKPNRANCFRLILFDDMADGVNYPYSGFPEDKLPGEMK